MSLCWRRWSRARFLVLAIFRWHHVLEGAGASATFPFGFRCCHGIEESKARQEGAASALKR
jgi:hypothetical protein